VALVLYAADVTWRNGLIAAPPLSLHFLAHEDLVAIEVFK